MSDHQSSPIVEISSVKFLLGCLAVGLILGILGLKNPWPAWFIATEVFLTIIALFLFGSMKYRIHKNALTYGMGFVIFASFFGGWWQSSILNPSFYQLSQKAGTAGEVNEQLSLYVSFFREHFLTLHGLDNLIHADTLLFILGLTFFVAVIAQTRLLESVSFAILKKNTGRVIPTVALLTALVAAASGILDGVSMIGLMIRTLVIIMFLARAPKKAVIYVTIVSTVITTVCGMWLAYGEPPNLIMKSNLHPYLDNAFFLRYCLPIAVGSYLIVFWNLRKNLAGLHISLGDLDVLDRHTAEVRFLQAEKHGEVMTPAEYAEAHPDKFSGFYEPVLEKLKSGTTLGHALLDAKVPSAQRQEILGHCLSEDMAPTLDAYYQKTHNAPLSAGAAEASRIEQLLDAVRDRRLRAQRVGLWAFVPFIGGLIWHGFNHDVPLFWASFAGFAVAFFGIAGIPKMRRLALKEGKHEFAEYYFLIPLFFSVTLLQKTGFFEAIAHLIQWGISAAGVSAVALAQFYGATFLSALLDNNVVADFAAHALHGLEIGILHLFAMAQIAGYAAGGCWTHIGSAQSVVAYAFVQNNVDERYTPFQWIKAMTPLLVEILVFVTAVVLILPLFVKG